MSRRPEMNAEGVIGPEPVSARELERMRQAWESAIATRQEAQIRAVGAYTEWERARLTIFEASEAERAALAAIMTAIRDTKERIGRPER